MGTAGDELAEDRAWLDGFRKGDRSALERVFRAYSGVVATIMAEGVGLKSGGRVPGVEFETQQELIHDAFIKAFAEPARMSFDGLRPYAPYLAQIARNVLADHWRRQTTQKRAAATVDLDGGIQIESDAPLPDRVAIASELRSRLQTFLDGLSEEDRRFVQLRFVEQRGQEELADVLGVTRHRVRSWDESIQVALDGFLKAYAGD